MIPEGKRGRLPVIDALRGLAASVVLIHHLDVLFPNGLTRCVGRATIVRALVDEISRFNFQAVLVFFVISGFCIRHASRKYDFRIFNDVTQYGVKRLGRILPPYLIALAYTFVVGEVIGQTTNISYSTKTLLGNLFFLQSPAGWRGTWFPPYGGDGPLWSLSFEVFYYLIYPIIVILHIYVIIPWLRGKIPCPLVILSFSVSNIALIFYNLLPNPILLCLSFYYVWILGAAVNDVYRDRGGARPLILVLSVLALGMETILRIRASAIVESMLIGTVITVIWLLAQQIRVFWDIPTPKAINLVVRITAGVGAISYSLYLIHYPTLELARFLWQDSFSGLLLAAFASFLLAAVVETAGWKIRSGMLKSSLPKAALTEPPSLPAILPAVEGERGSKRWAS